MEINKGVAIALVEIKKSIAIALVEIQKGIAIALVELCAWQQQLVSTSTHSQPPNALTLMHFLYNPPVAGCSDAHLQNAEAAVNSATALNVAASDTPFARSVPTPMQMSSRGRLG